jgi:predicted nucleic acid-binding protein
VRRGSSTCAGTRTIGFSSIVEPESSEFDRLFREFSSKPHPSPKLWADAYLAALARTTGLTLTTFDRTFEGVRGLNVCTLSAGG